MRRPWALAIMMTMGCTGSDTMPVDDEYEAYEQRVEVDCGTYAKNYPPDVEPPKALCGEKPDVECLNSAIGSGSVAKLTYLYYIHSGTLERDLLRESEYYTDDDHLVRFQFIDQGYDLPLWFRLNCTRLQADSYELDGTTCWTLTPVDCTPH